MVRDPSNVRGEGEREGELFFSLFLIREPAKLDFYTQHLKHMHSTLSMYVVITRKQSHEDKLALLIKEREVDTTMWMDKRLRERGMTAREIEERRGLNPWGPVW